MATVSVVGNDIRVPILMYHRVFEGRADAASVPGGVRRYSVSASEFARHIAALEAEGYAPVPLAALLPDGPPITVAKPIVITFDDGWDSDVTLARPILDRLGWRSEHFVTVGWTDTPGFMAWADLRKLAEAGQGVHSHSMSHADFGTLSLAGARFELALSKARLEACIERPVDFFALPGGHGASRVIERLARSVGYRGMCTSEIGTNEPGRASFRLRRLAVTGDTTPARLVQWTSGSGLGRLRVVRRTFRVARQLIGARRYDRLKETLLSARGSA